MYASCFQELVEKIYHWAQGASPHQNSSYRGPPHRGRSHWGYDEDFLNCQILLLVTTAGIIIWYQWFKNLLQSLSNHWQIMGYIRLIKLILFIYCMCKHILLVFSSQIMNGGRHYRAYPIGNPTVTIIDIGKKVAISIAVITFYVVVFTNFN